jgi:C4-dicarboxylate transporter, DctM subunit
VSNLQIGLLSIVVLFAFILSGVHIAVALFLISFVGMVLITGRFDVAMTLLGQTANRAVSDYVFAVVPLFILMGAFMTNSRAASDLYLLLHRVLGAIRGGLGIATVYANAVFAAVTGVSVASAAVFSRIAYPQMVAHGYSKRLSLGTVAGSSVLGMLIPPSLLLILYGILAQVSIGRLFIAGIIPGLLLAFLYSVGIFIMGVLRPESVGRAPKRAVERTGPGNPHEDTTRVDGPSTAPAEPHGVEGADLPFWKLLVRAGPIFGLVALVLGGIWGGYFTPTEAGAVGAMGALVLGGMVGMRGKGFIASFRETAAAAGSILLLLIAASMYSRMLAASGVVGRIGRTFAGWDVSELLIVLLFVVFLIILGAVLDSSSIILLTVPLMMPVITQMDINPLWFGIILIVAVEVGLLTPPFGMVPFTMSGVLGRSATVEDIFIGSFPFFIMMLVLIGLLIAFPGLVTWLPGLL